MRVILILCFSLIGFPLFSEDISLDVIKSYPMGNILMPVYEEGNFYFRGIEGYQPGQSVKPYDYNIYSVNSSTGKIRIIFKGGVNCFEGDNELLIIGVEENKKTRKREYSLIIYDLQKQRVSKTLKGNAFASFISTGHNTLYYQNNIFLTSGPSADPEIMEDLYYFSVEKGFKKRIIEGIHPVSMTKDKLHILLYPDIRTGFNDQFFQLEVSEMDKAVKEKIIVKGFLEKKNLHYPGLQIGFKGSYLSNIRYISNNLLLAPIRKRGLPVWTLFDLTGKKIDTINFSLDNKSFKEIMYIQFSDDFSHAFAMISGGKTVFLLNSSSFRDWLLARNLLFHPTKARLTDSSVRLREYPNLESRTLGFLDKDEEVEVLDRSGIPVQIGEMKDYWYKVENQKGKTGWAYGAFFEFEQDEKVEKETVKDSH